MAYIDEINEKWDDYKCNPVIMPVAGYIKKDAPNPIEFTNKNFEDCATILMTPIAESGVNMPVKPVLGVFGDVLGSLNDSVFSVFGVLVHRFRMMMMTVLLSMSNTFNTVSSKTQSTGFRIQYIMKRIGGIMTTIVYKLASLVKLQEASYNYSLNLTKIILGIGLAVGLFNTPVMIFTTSMIALLKLDGIKFCFHPESIVTLINGQKIRAKNVTPGHILENGELITFSFKLKPQGKKFFTYKNRSSKFIVTEDHKVYDKLFQRYVNAEDHPHMVQYNCEEPEYLVCWNTSYGFFEQESVIYQDYEGKPLVNQAEGLDGDALVPIWIENQYISHKKAKYIQLGDVIGLNKTEVLGLVKTRIEINQKMFIKHGNEKIYMGKDSEVIIPDCDTKNYIIEGDLLSPKKQSPYLYTFITDKGEIEIKSGIIFKDYEKTEN
jgi:hypothetical protein